MRRQDREVKEFKDLIRIMRKCDVCRLALNDPKGYPYLLPLNFGMEVEQESIFLYFHGALEGTKYELIRNDPRASFEMDCEHRLVADEKKGSCTMEYESVIGCGTIEILGEEQKERALNLLMEQYYPQGFAFNRAVMPRTAVFRLRVESLTGKRRKKHQRSSL